MYIASEVVSQIPKQERLVTRHSVGTFGKTGYVLRKLVTRLSVASVRIKTISH